MIKLLFTVDNISIVSQIYDRIRIQRATAELGTFVEITSLVPAEIELQPNQSSYTVIDYAGETTYWYRSQYYNSSDPTIFSSWSDPVLGEQGDLHYNPLYPAEISYGTSDKRIINRIRTLIGDPIGLRREYGEEAYSSVHPDGHVYEMDEKGWPANITMGGTPYNDGTNPYVNGYKYLVFSEDISDSVMISGTLQTVDIWYYTFRYSDREIMETYDNTPPPPGLTETTATSEAYMIACAIDLLRSEFILDSTEDGAVITDEGSRYDPSPGLRNRKDLLDDLKKKLDDLIKTLMLSGIQGVLID